jgi:hypothetical protein
VTTSIGTASSLASGDGRPLIEPGALFVDGNYRLRFNVWCSVAGVTIALRSRFLRSEDGKIVDSADQLTPTSDRVLTTSAVTLGVGFPLNVEVFALAGTPSIGQCFVQVQMVRGDGPAATKVATILQGYVTSTMALSWPGSPIVNSLDGQGCVVSYRQVAAPGGDLQFSVPTGARWVVISFHGNLTTSGAIPTRRVSLQYTDLVQAYVQSPIAAAQAGSTAFDYTWMTGYGQQITDGVNRVGASLPTPSPMLAGYQIGTATVNLDAADHWTLLDLAVQEWIDV